MFHPTEAFEGQFETVRRKQAIAVPPRVILADGRHSGEQALYYLSKLAELTWTSANIKTGPSKRTTAKASALGLSSEEATFPLLETTRPEIRIRQEAVDATP